MIILLLQSLRGSEASRGLLLAYMNNTDNLFFELIQVALGVRVCLSHSPNAREWKALYDMAKKQSLVGVCFAGVQKLYNDDANDDDNLSNPSNTSNLSELQYLTWMGMAAKIQQRNEVVNKQCFELQTKISTDGMRSSILKGQGVANLYGEHLRGLRQSGDIDVYVDCGIDKALAYAKGICGEVDFDYINAHLPIYDDTEVELHWRLSQMSNLRKNKKLQKWVKVNEEKLFAGIVILPNGEQIATPSVEANLFYLLVHIYNHEFTEGIGLRQLMDYYFVLRTSYENDNENIVELFKQFGMMRFAKGIMWIMGEVFKLDVEYMPCKPDEKEGRFLLTEIMQNGNFGHHDERTKKVSNNYKIQAFANRLQHNWHLATHYPSEFFWAPIWLVYHYLWKRTRK